MSGARSPRAVSRSAAGAVKNHSRTDGSPVSTCSAIRISILVGSVDARSPCPQSRSFCSDAVAAVAPTHFSVRTVRSPKASMQRPSLTIGTCQRPRISRVSSWYTSLCSWSDSAPRSFVR